MARHQCITFETLGATGAWPFVVEGREVSVPVHSRLVVNTAEAAIDAALAGVGVARVLSYQVEDDRRAGRLDVVLKEFEAAPIPVSLVYAGQQRLALKLRAFLDYSTPRLRERLGLSVA